MKGKKKKGERTICVADDLRVDVQIRLEIGENDLHCL
jgi:hypothetical protein